MTAVPMATIPTAMLHMAVSSLESLAAETPLMPLPRLYIRPNISETDVLTRSVLPAAVALPLPVAAPMPTIPCLGLSRLSKSPLVARLVSSRRAATTLRPVVASVRQETASAVRTAP